MSVIAKLYEMLHTHKITIVRSYCGTVDVEHRRVPFKSAFEWAAQFFNSLEEDADVVGGRFMEGDGVGGALIIYHVFVDGEEHRVRMCVLNS